MITAVQAQRVLHDYAPYVHVSECRPNTYRTVCTGTEEVCEYHAKACVPVNPVRYTFSLRWNTDKKRIIVTTKWAMTA